MKLITLLLAIFAALACVAVYVSAALGQTDTKAPTVLGGKLPPGYRDWRLISVAHEGGELNDIRAVLGNDIAIRAYRDAKDDKFSFPEGAIIARLAWRFDASAENNKTFGRAQSFVAGPPVNGVQFMVKDSKKFAATGGWGFAQFDDGKSSLDAAKIKSCFDCHALIKDRDLVFTRYAP